MVGEAGDGRAGAALTRKLLPQVVVMDLLKTADWRDVATGIRALAAGAPCFSPEISKVVVSGYLEHAAGMVVDRDPLSRLTVRERQALKLIAEGHSNKGIAARLSLSVHTVEAHRKSLMSKLDLHNTAEVVRFALQRGIID